MCGNLFLLVRTKCMILTSSFLPIWGLPMGLPTSFTCMPWVFAMFTPWSIRSDLLLSSPPWFVVLRAEPSTSKTGADFLIFLL